jgi:hypothetical protein
MGLFFLLLFIQLSFRNYTLVGYAFEMQYIYYISITVFYADTYYIVLI